MPKPRHLLKLLHNCATADFVVRVPNVQGHTHKVWPQLQHHAHCLHKHGTTARHQGHLAGFQVVPEGSGVGPDHQAVEHSQERALHADRVEHGRVLLCTLEERD